MIKIKMKTKLTFLTIMLALVGLSSNAQSEKCATMKILEKRIAKDPSLLELNKQQQDNFIADTKALLKTSTLVRFYENDICRHKRK